MAANLVAVRVALDRLLPRSRSAMRRLPRAAIEATCLLLADPSRDHQDAWNYLSAHCPGQFSRSGFYRFTQSFDAEYDQAVKETSGESLAPMLGAITPDECARRLMVDPIAVRRLITSGRLVLIDAGGEPRIPLDSLQRLLSGSPSMSAKDEEGSKAQ